MFKLMNNSVFSKAMENKRVDIKLVKSSQQDKLKNLIENFFYTRTVPFTADIAGVVLRQSKTFLKKPIFVGMTVLDLSKVFMHDFCYGHLKK